MMNGQKVVKVFTHEEESIENFNKLNDQLFHSADNANKFGNILMPVNAQIGNISYVLCALVGGVLALNGVGGFTLGKLASFLTSNNPQQNPTRHPSRLPLIMAIDAVNIIRRFGTTSARLRCTKNEHCNKRKRRIRPP